MKKRPLYNLKVEDLKTVYEFEYVNPTQKSSSRLSLHMNLSPKGGSGVSCKVKNRQYAGPEDSLSVLERNK